MAVTKTREQRRIENHERALAAYLEHHAAAVTLISRIGVAVANHDLAPDLEAITWGTCSPRVGTHPRLCPTSSATSTNHGKETHDGHEEDHHHRAAPPLHGQRPLRHRAARGTDC